MPADGKQQLKNLKRSSVVGKIRGESNTYVHSFELLIKMMLDF